ncbi:MAG: hypothetical protein MUC50_16275, partial [Myxococcota bacterium]|nr:hypothetical protein [Myxococcota bacterium]
LQPLPLGWDTVGDRSRGENQGAACWQRQSPLVLSRALESAGQYPLSSLLKVKRLRQLCRALISPRLNASIGPFPY